MLEKFRMNTKEGCLAARGTVVDLIHQKGWALLALQNNQAFHYAITADGVAIVAGEVDLFVEDGSLAAALGAIKENHAIETFGCSPSVLYMDTLGCVDRVLFSCGTPDGFGPGTQT